jgi:hypothetical protein
MSTTEMLQTEGMFRLQRNQPLGTVKEKKDNFETVEIINLGTKSVVHTKCNMSPQQIER